MAVSASITITQNSQSISGNSSNVTVRGYGTTTGASYNNYNLTGSRTINGSSANFTTTLPKQTKKLLFSWTGNIAHNNDGSKTLSASFSLATGISAGTIRASTSKTLAKIPRASSISGGSGNIGSATSIKISRASSSLTHRIYYAFGSIGKTLIASGVGTSYTWTIPTSFYAQTPNATSRTGTLYCETYAGSTKVGEKSITFTAKVVNSNPIFTDYEYEDVNEKTVLLTGDNQTIVKGLSTLKLIVTPDNKMIARNSAKPVKYRANVGTKTQEQIYSATNDVLFNIPLIDSNQFYMYAIDSRGLSTQVARTSVNYVNYKAPTIDNLSVERIDGISTVADLVASGTYFNESFGSIVNSIVRIDYSIDGGLNWTDITNLFEINTETGIFTSKDTAKINGFEIGQEYNFILRIIDGNGETLLNQIVSDIIQIGSGEPIMVHCKEDKVTSFGLLPSDELPIGALQTASGVFDDNGEPIAAKQKILWQTTAQGLYMSAGQVVTFSEPVNKQANGLILVWQLYDPATALKEDSNFKLEYIPKLFVEIFPGRGHTLFFNTAGFGRVAGKYLYIGNTHMSGNATSVSTGAYSGITFDNRRWVLTYVLGV